MKWLTHLYMSLLKLLLQKLQGDLDLFTSRDLPHASIDVRDLPHAFFPLTFNNSRLKYYELSLINKHCNKTLLTF